MTVAITWYIAKMPGVVVRTKGAPSVPGVPAVDGPLRAVAAGQPVPLSAIPDDVTALCNRGAVDAYVLGLSSVPG